MPDPDTLEVVVFVPADPPQVFDSFPDEAAARRFVAEEEANARPGRLKANAKVCASAAKGHATAIRGASTTA